MRKSELILAKYTYEAKAPFCVPLPILSRCQAERTQGLYPDTTVDYYANWAAAIKPVV